MRWCADLANKVIILPRIVPHVRNFSPDRFPTNDRSSWDVARLRDLVAAFCSATGATTLPSLAEWSVLPDKVRRLVVPLSSPAEGALGG